MARIEAGYLAAYMEFLPADETVRTGVSRSPLELGLEWLVDFKKPNFNGRRALAEEKRNGSTWRLVKLDIEGNKPAHNSYIFANAKAQWRKHRLCHLGGLVARVQTEHRARHGQDAARQAR